MTNRFFTNGFNAPVGSQAKSAALNAMFAALEQACALIQAELDAIQGLQGVTSLAGFPASFSGAAGKYLRVNTGESAVEFVSSGRLIIKSIAGTSYTLTAADAGALLVFTNASAVTVTVPKDVMTQGDVVCIRQGNTGQVTLSPASGVTLASTDNRLATRTQSAQIAVIADGGNAFGVIGERDFPTLNFASLIAANLFTKAQTVTPVTLTDAASIATDASLSNTFKVTLGGNRTLANPTNLSDGVILNWRITQDGTGSRTLAYGSKFKWAGGSAPTLTTTAGAVDYIVAQYFSDTDILVGSIIKDVR
jgi:hypothetical protein